MKILVLYEELAWYFINCMNEFAGSGNCEVLIFSKVPNNNAPFQFSYVHPNITLKNREAFTHEQLLKEVRNFNPDGIFLGGWAHKPYLDLVKKLRIKATVIGFDNQWQDSVKQRLGAFYFRKTIKPYIQYAFVPGQKQFTFARHLGFKEEKITLGAYCCDMKLFNGYYENYREQKKNDFPKRFLYVGRYAAEKGILDLWSAFIEWHKETPNEWELWCLGRGEISPPLHEKMRHFGFVQPEAMKDIIKGTGVFVLPSTFEPWGVVVQEYAAAGFPLLCSTKTGAADTFVEEGKNGFLFEAGNKEQLKEKMNKFSTLKPNELVNMAEKSVEMANKITPAIWAQRLRKMFSE